MRVASNLSCCDQYLCRQKCNNSCESRFNVPKFRPQLYAKQLTRLPFFIHENEVFNFSRLSSVLDQHLQGRPIDLVASIGDAQYAIELPILRGLDTHPFRTYDAEEAMLHVAGVAPVASYLAAIHVEGNVSFHRRRMRQAARMFHLNKYFQQGRPFLFLFGHHLKEILGKRLMRVLGSGKNLIVASTDPSFSRLGKWSSEGLKNAIRDAVTVPMVAHSMAHEIDVQVPQQRIRDGVMFHGGLGRCVCCFSTVTRLPMSSSRDPRLCTDMTTGFGTQ